MLDPAEFPDALVSTPNGLSRDNIIATVRELTARFDVVGFSVVEFRPRSDDALTRLRQLLDRCGIGIGALGTRR